ncbi:hypothetical protein, partial [Chitinimonas sp.]|uniref:hypothetical protein n=1 Tax=Chitinimonas sp. TaxID=1934313 RepID=UPI0035B19DFB
MLIHTPHTGLFQCNCGDTHEFCPKHDARRDKCQITITTPDIRHGFCMSARFLSSTIKPKPIKHLAGLSTCRAQAYACLLLMFCATLSSKNRASKA